MGVEFGRTGNIECHNITYNNSFQDMQVLYYDDKYWFCIMRHNINNYMTFSPDTALYSTVYDLYSRMNEIEQYKQSNYEFLVKQIHYNTIGEVSTQTANVHYSRWQQSNNPLTSTEVTGYINIYNGEGGLIKGNDYCLCMSPNETGYICAYDNANVIGYNNIKLKNPDTLELYIAADLLDLDTTETVNIYDQYIECADFIEY